ncbi:hypothetical protein BCBMB205_39360 [Bacillus sp. CN2]|nr:hypothetical protein BCBMB205_39360 [Bacillus velezensis]ARZ60282.1 hypothetical protein BAGQ_4078 [Bacillus velezensis]GFR55361.1 hypothetical protein BCBMB205_39360 [Bacillus sp. CN2]
MTRVQFFFMASEKRHKKSALKKDVWYDMFHVLKFCILK